MDFVNFRTTVMGAIAGLSQILKVFGVDVPPYIFDGITGIAIPIAFYFAKDKNVTGGTKQNR